jgi:hypothetical protein
MLSITMVFVMSKIAHTVIVVSGVFSAHPLMFCARQSNNRLEFNREKGPKTLPICITLSNLICVSALCVSTDIRFV